jgi:hypothetical protein
MEKLFNAKADAQGFVGDTKFSYGVEKHEVKVTPEQAAQMQLEGMPIVESESEMDKRIALESFNARAAAVNKKRVFNKQPVRLSLADLDQLEMAVKLGELPPTTGFFFGEDSSSEHKEYDLKVIEAAKSAISDYNLDVYYDSWW